MRAILVSLHTKEKRPKELKESIQELEGLVKALNGKVIGKLVQKKDIPEPSTFIGKGKAKQLAQIAEGTKADTIIIDTELTPVQISNLEKITNVSILDRTDLILSIFEKRAKTKQAKLQVELAVLEHELPRVYNQRGKHLSRIGGGYKTKGAGEKLGEIKVRRIKERISKIKKELKNIKSQNYQQRKSRNKDPNTLKVSLVGYTNAGKSTLLKRLTKRDTYISDKLFATLDTKTSYIYIPQINKKVLITDTVGFVKDLPESLLEAFMTTLEELYETDLILHTVDVSDENWTDKVEAVENILKKLNLDTKPTVLVLNKIDKVIPSKDYIDEEDETLLALGRETIVISAEKKWNLDKLRDILEKYAIQKSYYHMEV
ncbi:MAG: GTPase HflX [Aquificae bacterium]|nr:GTPase HflX [Aquificota bacterium]